MEQEHICPYCGEEIKREDILFWEKVKRQYTDNVRGNFLQRHGVEVPPGNKFDRLYYRLREDCIVREDENGWPTMIEDHLGNAVTPEDLSEGRVLTGKILLTATLIQTVLITTANRPPNGKTGNCTKSPTGPVLTAIVNCQGSLVR